MINFKDKQTFFDIIDVPKFKKQRKSYRINKLEESGCYLDTSEWTRHVLTIYQQIGQRIKKETFT